METFRKFVELPELRQGVCDNFGDNNDNDDDIDK